MELYREKYTTLNEAGEKRLIRLALFTVLLGIIAIFCSIFSLIVSIIFLFCIILYMIYILIYVLFSFKKYMDTVYKVYYLNSKDLKLPKDAEILEIKGKIIIVRER